MRFGTFTSVAAAALAAGMALVAPQTAKATLLDFTGPNSNEYGGDYVASYYNGEFACSAVAPCIPDAGPGPNDGVTFSNTAMAYSQGADFSNSPSGAAVGSDGSYADAGSSFSMTFTPGASVLSFDYASESCYDANIYEGSCTPATNDASVEVVTPGEAPEIINLADNYDTADDSLDIFTPVSFAINPLADELIFSNVDDPLSGFDTAFFTDVSVPEPASLSLFIAGLFVFGATRRRRMASHPVGGI